MNVIIMGVVLQQLPNELNPMCAGKSLCNVMLLIEERKQAHLPATYVIQSHYIFPVLFLLCGLGESAT